MKGAFWKRCVAVCLSLVMVHTANTLNFQYATAENISDLEAQMEANSEEIKKKKEEMAELEEKAENAREYLETLSEEIDLHKLNIELLNDELDRLEQEIEALENKIEELEEKIAEQKEQIDTDIEKFRQRLRLMYVSGNDNYASILTGATDFYDLLARYELMTRVAAHDDEMIDDLNIELDLYNERNEELHTQQEELETKRRDAELKRDILQGEMNDLVDDYTESQKTLEELEENEMLTESDIDWLANQNEQLAGEIEEIKEQERIAAEKARQEAEERERQRQEELERQRQEAERLAAQQTSSDDSSSESYDYDYNIDTSVTTYSGERSEIVDYAKTYLGIYYQWCGNYPSGSYYGLDCSHFTYRVLEHFGLMDSYMDSRGQCRYCTEISESELQPGDLVFYSSGGRVEHVTMYIGGGQVIGAQGGDSWVDTESEAESCNAKVKIVSLYNDNRTKTYGRVPGLS